MGFSLLGKSVCFQQSGIEGAQLQSHADLGSNCIPATYFEVVALDQYGAVSASVSSSSRYLEGMGKACPPMKGWERRVRQYPALWEIHQAMCAVWHLDQK